MAISSAGKKIKASGTNLGRAPPVDTSKNERYVGRTISGSGGSGGSSEVVKVDISTNTAPIGSKAEAQQYAEVLKKSSQPPKPSTAPVIAKSDQYGNINIIRGTLTQTERSGTGESNLVSYTYSRGQVLKESGLPTATFRPEFIPSVVEDINKRRRESVKKKDYDLPEKSQGSEYQLLSEDAERVRINLAEKQISQTLSNYPGNNLNLDAFKTPYQTAGGIINIDYGYRAGFSTEAEARSYFLKEELKTKPYKIFSTGLKLLSEKAYSMESTLPGAGLLFVSKGAETIYTLSPLGIGESILSEGPIETIKSYNPINFIKATAENKLLRSKTELGRVAEFGGIVAGAYGGNYITRQTVINPAKQKFKAVVESRRNKMAYDTYYKEVPESATMLIENNRGLFRKYEPTLKFKQGTLQIGETETGKPIYTNKFLEGLRPEDRALLSKPLNFKESGATTQSLLNVQRSKQIKYNTKIYIENKKVIIENIPSKSLQRPKAPPTRPKIINQKKLSLSKKEDPFLDFEVESVSSTYGKIKLRLGKRGSTGVGTVQIPRENKIAPTTERSNLPETIRPKKLELILLPPVSETYTQQGSREVIGPTIRQKDEDKLILLPEVKLKEEPITDKEFKEIPRSYGYEDTSAEINPPKEKTQEKIGLLPVVDTYNEYYNELDIYKPTPRRPTIKEPERPADVRLPIKKEDTGNLKSAPLFRIKSNNKFLSYGALPRFKALNIGAKITDLTKSIKFKIIPAGKSTGVVDDPAFILSSKFAKINGEYIEKKKYRFDAPQERRKLFKI